MPSARWGDGTQPVWRLENYKGDGVYTVSNYFCLHGSFDATRHPDPNVCFKGKPFGLGWYANDGHRGKNDRFGFTSLWTLRRWFHLEEIAAISAITNGSVGVSLYKAFVRLESPRQCIFDLSKSERLAFKSLTLLLGATQ